MNELRACPLRYRFRAREAIHFPMGSASNVFRGAFGWMLRRVACEPRCAGVTGCPLRGECVYIKIFEPRGGTGGPSGFRDQPRPFRIRAASLDGRRFRPGEEFEIEVINFDLNTPVFEYFRLAMIQLVAEGLGPGRSKVELVEAEKKDPICVSLACVLEPIHRLRIDYLTPTELKFSGKLLRKPDFGAVFSRARDRVSSILNLYQGGGPDLDFAGMGVRAKGVEMVEASVAERDFERQSTRTGQRHVLGGFVGNAVYEGNLGEFVPVLQAAQYTGIGRNSVWGHGEIRMPPNAM